MADEPENLVLVHLGRIDGKVDRLTDEVRDLKVRVTSIEETRLASPAGWTAWKSASNGSSDGSISSMLTEKTR